MSVARARRAWPYGSKRQHGRSSSCDTDVSGKERSRSRSPAVGSSENSGEVGKSSFKNMKDVRDFVAPAMEAFQQYAEDSNRRYKAADSVDSLRTTDVPQKSAEPSLDDMYSIDAMQELPHTMWHPNSGPDSSSIVDSTLIGFFAGGGVVLSALRCLLVTSITDRRPLLRV
eukprot:gnl/TRDRNA2_/TRDRNA2_174161_c1_seq5.p1 gnl/TRDRNA2_/TRDRNA2_174161_c1~~gnl/TRDRNA2_/TRDRNA2_174161_c1_seq5.p1  ORF type:complete len:186 (+),score=28.38 gnl/TRDRNA2_/TRDRNA2_174161_c1_seq5:48-560(+)